MSSLLKIGQTVATETSGLACTVEEYLGGGGQGEVYRAQWGGDMVALKWYFSHQASREQRESLATLVELGAPTPRFLWPIEIATSPQGRGFGYVMPLRSARYKSIVDLMMRRAEPGFRALITAAMELADSFLRLHSRGLCYRDISFGNVFFDPDTGEVLICDNDNVAVNGAARTGVLGTPRFMAPEVVRGEAAPSILTDLYSLSVLLFYLLVVHHPLEGRRESAIKCLDLPAMNRLYGEDPLFIFDPDNDANAPDDELHANAPALWPLYPAAVQRLFTRAFTAGLRDPVHRVRESEWRSAMARLRDQIFDCSCGQENFYCPDRHSDGSLGACWSCGAALSPPPRLRMSGSVVMLGVGARLYTHHISADRLYDFSTAIATVVENPVRPGRYGLRNLGTDPWRLTTADGTAWRVDPGRTAALTAGARIGFGAAEGEVEL